MVQSSGNERLTAFVSTVVAVAILAAGVTAHQSSLPKVTDVVQVASDLRFQLEMSFRHDIPERDSRLSQLDAVMEQWQASPQSDADRQALLAWLRDAGTRSLPGVMRELAPAPEFSKPATAVVETAPPVEHQVRKAPVSEAKPTDPGQAEVRENLQPELALPVPTLNRLYAQGPAPTRAPLTPTPTDPLEEEMIALKQPATVTSGVRDVTAQRPTVAPRPEFKQQPNLGEQNLLASVAPPRNSTLAKEQVSVNLTELAARIAGYHDSLDEVELVLLRMDTPDLAIVTEQVNRLDRMTRDYGFVQLYYDSLTAAERESVAEPRSMKATLGEVRRQLKRCEEVVDGDFLGTFDADAENDFADLRAKIAEIDRRTDR